MNAGAKCHPIVDETLKTTNVNLKTFRVAEVKRIHHQGTMSISTVLKMYVVPVYPIDVKHSSG